eukprot:TRINITY_DN1114_c0_g1_i8.p1 TRINITY_DN1114_c0_g1~~TRINITY_DN1114_c0_g1_i8.p1  ORF type:complete len:851 (-),score=75.67 TRINITY_DN1114_c0_g1_i8:13-2565(-)
MAVSRGSLAFVAACMVGSPGCAAAASYQQEAAHDAYDYDTQKSTYTMESKSSAYHSKHPSGDHYDRVAPEAPYPAPKPRDLPTEPGYPAPYPASPYPAPKPTYDHSKHPSGDHYDKAAPEAPYPAPKPRHLPKEPGHPTPYSAAPYPAPSPTYDHSRHRSGDHVPYPTKEPGYAPTYTPLKHAASYGPSERQYSPDCSSDEMYVTENLKTYPHRKYGHAKDGMDGYIMLSTKDCTQVLSYRLHGVDPECSKPGYGNEDACTIQVHEGETCDRPDKVYYKKHVATNPWTKVRYTSTRYRAEHEHVPVDAGLEADDVWGKTVVVYDSKGHQMACSRLERAKVAYAPRLAPYPGTETDLCIHGDIYLSTEKRSQTLTYDLTGVDPRCSTTDRLEEGRCSIRIHEGKDCSSAGKPFWIHGNNEYDPWNHVRYYTQDGDKAWDRHVKIYTGLPMAKIAYHTVVVYDYDGKRISCSKVFPVMRLKTSKLSVYPESNTYSEVKGRVKLTRQVHKTELTYKMKGIDPVCSGKKQGHALGCGVVVHEGYRCSEAGDVLWDKAYAQEDPWKNSLYAANYKHKAYGKNSLYTGKDLADMVGRAVVVYDSHGKPIACSTLKAPRVFKYQSEAVCKKPDRSARFDSFEKPQPELEPAPGPGPPEKKECFPADASVQLSENKTLPLWQVEVGHEILTKTASGQVSFENVVGIVHRIGGEASNTGGGLVAVEHELGSFRATSNHIIFTDAGERTLGTVRVGQYLHFMQGEVMATSRVHSVASSPSLVGLVSPVTASGNAIVDGVLVSTYADSHSATVSHAAMHAAFFVLRFAVAFIKAFPFVIGVSSLTRSMDYFTLLLPAMKGV